LVNQYNITKLMENPSLIDNEELNKIHNLIKEFPYFQTGQLLYCKGLKNIDSIRFKTQLRKTASHAGNRKLLYELILKESIRKEIKTTGIENNEYHSFMDWISIVQAKKINRSQNTNSSKIIDVFLETQPKISKKKKQNFFKPSEIAKESILENQDLVTETLAKVYKKQKHYEKAILTYQKLSLKYPQKSSYFADQIKLINQLKEN